MQIDTNNPPGDVIVVKYHQGLRGWVVPNTARLETLPSIEHVFDYCRPRLDGATAIVFVMKPDEV